ncbi:FG-GAP repeat domain-containing protein [Pedosphaera parvula]|uniref:Fibronectin type III domain protein n=1 Tax=Pedosphaera parvula (strain Ellin514) TaxID=320771 RepID=B9XP89_PEDPL|nr:hypothetical protein [Pedosphaera parvula]EEF58340.1 Fibronectin type III domain protein [Pedosphaera parvula Ellin514]
MQAVINRIQMHFAVVMCAVFCLAQNASATLLSSFQAGDGDWQLGTLTVGNVDGTPDLEIIVPYRNSNGQWLLDAFKWDGTRLAGFPWSDGKNSVMNTSPTLYDLDDDGKNEIIFTCGTNIIAMRGNGTIIWSNSVNRLNYIPTGGFQVVTNGFYWSATGSWISNLPTNSVFYSEVSPPIIADVEGKGVKEVITAWKIDPDSGSGNQDFNPFINDIWGSGEWGTMGESWSGGVVFHNAATGAKRFVYHIHQLVESGIGLGHADSNKPLEVYALNDSDSVVCFDKTQPHGLYGKGMLHGQFGKNQQLISGSYQQGVDVYPVDLDGDGLAEVLVPMSQFNPFHQPGDTILDDDGTILWRKWKQSVNYTNNHGWLNSACMIPVNPDHDNHIDVLTFSHGHGISFRYWNGIELVDRPGWPKDFSPLLPTPPVVGDVDGDGQQEIIIGTYDPTAVPSTGNLHVFALDGTEKQRIAIPGGVKHIPSLADVNNDGSLDVIFRSTLGKIYVYNFGATNATNVSWATHRGNPQHDGNYQLSLFPPGTPMISSKKSGYKKALFNWKAPAGYSPTSYRIYRAEQAGGPFTNIVTLPASVTSYTDSALKPGWQYFYEVAAVYSTGEVHSSPFAILAFLNNNLIANAGFEENDNSHWDKWYTGDLDWTNMIGNTNIVYQGKQSMEIQLINRGNNSSISQFDQYGIPDGTIPVTPGGLYSFGAWFKSVGISQPSEHWVEWGSTPTAQNANARPSLPFPNYFTPHFVIGTNATSWVYANRTFILPAGFPNLELRHRYTITGTGSGSMFIDNVFLRQLPAPNSTAWTDMVPFGSIWRYYTTTPPANWYATNFNDSTWAQGAAKLGAGSGPTNIVTTLPGLKPAYYFRKTFNLANTNLEEFLLSATCTDNGSGPSLQLYLNGRQIPTTDINCVSGQGNQTLYYDLAPYIDYLKTGANTIAVILNNTYSSWDDVSFDIDLKVIAAPLLNVTPPRISSVIPDAGGVTLNISTPSNGVWVVQSADTFSTTPLWQLVGAVTNISNTFQIRDTGQNGRVPPGNVSTRYYRVIAF